MSGTQKKSEPFKASGSDFHLNILILLLRGFLRCGAGVLGTALGVETALVADADAVLVVVAGMGAGEVLVAGLVQLTVALNVVVVAGEAEATVVAGDERGDRERPVLAGRRTVNND